LPLARAGGMTGIWFGIEDLTAELVNKGQKPEVTIELFRELHANRIMPMAMMMYHEGQPFRTPGSLYGLRNQVSFLRDAGAISVQLTVHIPAVGTREYENTYHSGNVLAALGDWQVPDAAIDGNHVIVAGREPMWRRQLKLWLGYASFYNPLNLVRAVCNTSTPLRYKAISYQAIGFLGVLWTGWSMLPYFVRLLLRRPQFHAGPPRQSSVPVRKAAGSFSRLPPGVAPDELVPLETPRKAA
jgi:hypothetical protein